MPVQNKPIIHARDHEEGGADPIRGLIPGFTTYAGMIQAEPTLWAYWPMWDPSGGAEELVAARDLTESELGDYALAYQEDGPIVEDETALAIGFSGVDAGDGAKLYRPEALSVLAGTFTFEVWAYAGDTGQGYIIATTDALTGVIDSYQFLRRNADGTLTWHQNGDVITGGTLNPAAWTHIALTYDATSDAAKLYVAGTEVETETLPAGGGGDHFIVGYNPVVGYWFTGRLSNMALYSSVLNAETIARHAAGTGVGSAPGWVLVPDPDNPDGPPIWQPPGIEIEHGDGDPDDTPVTTPPGLYAGTPENAAGWHLQAHFEYVVLYDSNPGRFDVPPRKWTRVPFNTVRIYRRWESTVDGNFVDAWLPDDRGLTEHAKNGVLLVTPGMAFAAGDGNVSGWFTIEYPVLDWAGLPNSTGGDEGVDAYMRAARMTNVTQGSVLRVGVGWGNHRQFFQWPFFSAPAEGVPIGYLVDNPYPQYPAWAGRDLNKPLPYPKMSSAESLTYYQTPVAHEPGFRLDQLYSDAARAAGDAISLQAWQDSPWTIRFGTDKYPPYTPYNYVQQFRKRPCLVLYHEYDPDTIDHTTGALL